MSAPSAPHRPDAVVTAVRVDDLGVRAESEDEVILDVLFDGRRIWSFWLRRDGTPDEGGHRVPWPEPLLRYLEGRTRLTVRRHVDGAVLLEEEHQFGAGTDRIAVVDEEGRPLGFDKSLRLAQTFDTRSREHVVPLLDAIESVLEALRAAGVNAFPAYGTLLGAVRDGTLIGHDSDADLGYVSEHSHPFDVVRESFQLQRRLGEMGYAISRYSGAAFMVSVREADGSVRGLDVFGGFLADGHLHLMGEIRAPFRREWIYPLGTTTLEGRVLPAPADTDRFLEATYGPTWRVPDPAYKFETPGSTQRRLNGWFRGTRAKRSDWDAVYAAHPGLPSLEPSDFARWVHAAEGEQSPGVGHLVDLGCGRGVDAYWFATQGRVSLGLDFVPRAAAALAAHAAQQGVPVTYRGFNLQELRSSLTTAAEVARTPAPRIVTARHLADATDAHGRGRLWRSMEMMLRAGGRGYLEFLVRRGRGDSFARENHLRRLPMDLAVSELQARGARVLHREVLAVPWHGKPEHAGPGELPGVRRIGRLVVTWE